MATTQHAQRTARSTEYGVTALPKSDPVLASNKVFRALDGLDLPGMAAADPRPRCAGHPDPEMFFPVGAADADNLAEATAVCAGCPLAARCLAVAQATGADGVWGGQLLAGGRPTQLKVAGRPPRTRAVA